MIPPAALDDLAVKLLMADEEHTAVIMVIMRRNSAMTEIVNVARGERGELDPRIVAADLRKIAAQLDGTLPAS